MLHWFFTLATFAFDHRIVAGALVLAGVGAAVRLYVPVIGKPLATGIWIAAAAIGAYGQGYANRAAEDRSAAIQAQLVEARREIAATNDIAASAKLRAVVAETERDRDNEKVRDYEAQLAKAGDCGLSPGDVDSLQHIGAVPAVAPRVARRLWPARARTQPDHARAIGRGAKAVLSEYRAALAEANRRLRNDAAFYDDVRREFGEQR
jgi:hypothetical protein